MKKNNDTNQTNFLASIVIKIGNEIKSALEEAVLSFKSEYDKGQKNSNDKTISILKGLTLLFLGIYAILPEYENIVAVFTGAIFGLFSTASLSEELKNKLVTLRSLLGLSIGIIIGMVVGSMPLIGIGITIGITKALVESILDIIDIEKSKASANINALSIMSERLKTGLLFGIIPIIGPLIVVNKLNKVREVIHLPKERSVTKTNQKIKANPKKKTPTKKKTTTISSIKKTKKMPSKKK